MDSSRRRPGKKRIPFASIVSDFIRFRCQCGRVLQVPESLAGQEALCPACHSVESVPAPAPEPMPEAPKHESRIPELAPMEEAAPEEVPELEPMDDAPPAPEA